MEWYVIRYNINSRQIEPYNILKTREKDFALIKKKANKDKKEFEKLLNNEIRYYYWCRSEWEVMVSGWPVNTDGKEAYKLDVYEQIKLNWNVFVDYCWNYKYKKNYD